MFIGCTFSVLLLMALIIINSQDLFDVVATDFFADFAATHPLKHPWRGSKQFHKPLDFQLPDHFLCPQGPYTCES
jgi:hypothetical protein